PVVTGKPVGDDLKQRKMTLPVIAALESGDEAAARVAEIYGSPAAVGEDVDRLARLIEHAGGRSATEQLAREELRQALDGLGGAGLSADGLALCEAYAGVTVGRI